MAHGLIVSHCDKNRPLHLMFNDSTKIMILSLIHGEQS